MLCCSDDYIGFSDTSRASIQMTHSAFGPTVSLQEAQRLERETADHLLKARKLSLIVDLDQTIVHATVDPTVGEWIAEGEAWEQRSAKRQQRKERQRAKEDEKERKKGKGKAKREKGEDDSDEESSSGEDVDDDETESEVEDECNPNWEALKDVKKFRLGPESFAATPSRGSKDKQKVIESEGVMYYIKPRYVPFPSTLHLPIIILNHSCTQQARLGEVDERVGEQPGAAGDLRGLGGVEGNDFDGEGEDGREMQRCWAGHYSPAAWVARIVRNITRVACVGTGNSRPFNNTARNQSYH